MASYDDTGTVSGSIVRVNDGADSVQLKNWLVTLPASLSGYSEVNGTKSGTNLFDEEWESGWIDNNGEEAVNASRVRSKNYNTIKGNVSYYVVASYSWRVYFYDASKTFISYVGTYTTNRSITSPANAVYFRFAVINTAPTSIGLNYPSTETSYVASRISVVTASLGRTIYGGQADIVTGEGEDENGNTFTFTPITAETELGTNNFWAEEGNTELTYYKDGYGFTSITVHKETPDGEPVEQTAKLHKIVYGGLVDVISGKAEPKNLLKVTGEKTTYADITYTVNEKGQVFANGTATALRSFRVIKNGDPGFSFKKGVTYTLSGCPSGGSDQTYQLDLRTTNTVGTFFMNAKDYGNGVTFTPTEDAVAFPIILVRNGQVCDNLTFNPQIEVNGSKTEYAPHFDPFTFQPISMETDEGENTLYADEGDSAITYRKAVE